MPDLGHNYHFFWSKFSNSFWIFHAKKLPNLWCGATKMLAFCILISCKSKTGAHLNYHLGLMPIFVCFFNFLMLNNSRIPKNITQWFDSSLVIPQVEHNYHSFWSIFWYFFEVLILINFRIHKNFINHDIDISLMIPKRGTIMIRFDSNIGIVLNFSFQKIAEFVVWGHKNVAVLFPYFWNPKSEAPLIYHLIWSKFVCFFQILFWSQRLSF